MSNALRVLLKIIFDAKNQEQLINTFYLKFELLKDLSLDHRKIYVHIVLFKLKEFQKKG